MGIQWKLDFFSVLLFEPENELALDFVETINEKLKLEECVRPAGIADSFSSEAIRSATRVQLKRAPYEESAAEFDVDDSDDEDDYTDDDDDDDSDDSDDSDSNEDEKSDDDDDEENDKDDDDGDDDDEEEEEVDDDHKQKEPFLAKERKCQISEKDYP
ncbi:hypothetical protein CAPTEDRAFT_199369 [Capitella teleta]|uniref:Uncharacterized protein n=1 Tax=Capitella teleta TaxID=283909 RepID=R7UX11_CAPTE|nr:hypothetical protein CAPTEDRAFT_199369 [Capitella teleta]|eukprot:ELU10874.1 hypothetical protein CAPTEDRAFT_199369 [Capitella teleta]